MSFGARGNGYSIASGQAYFDNFEIVSGTVLPIPEPASIALLTLAAPLLLRRRVG
ncbi:MAG: PEP-CTERM sorting domain-containing protein [Phycisphaerales bacterium]|nr:PEP-CTERM sorting domain-containing protein [Phycisphaerales bacterium]